MRAQIYTFVKKLANSNGSSQSTTTNSEEVQKANQARFVKLSSKFESMMYQLAPSFEVYADMKTFSSRLRIIAMQLGMQMESGQQRTLTRNDSTNNNHSNNRDELEERQREDITSTTSATTTTTTNSPLTPSTRTNTDFATQRCQLLRRKLGNPKYQEVVQLVSEVIQFRRRFNASNARNCGLSNNRTCTIRNRQRRANSIDSVDTIELSNTNNNNSPSLRTPRLGSPSQQQQQQQRQPQEQLTLSPAVRAMYFHTRLVDAMKSVGSKGTTSLQIARVNNVNWDELIGEAKDNLANVKDVQYELLCRGTCC